MSDEVLIADGRTHRNLELKAKYPNMGTAATVVERLGAEIGGLLTQTDTYFDVPRGRLKLREIEGRGSELIGYRRPSDTAERWSDFRVAPVTRPDAMKAVLTDSLGVASVVKKRRRLFLWNNCRIHLDEVDTLGAFIEFEVLSAGDDNDDVARMTELRREFGIPDRDIITGSYIDLIQASAA
jgi:adenylate cyclase, class 2